MRPARLVAGWLAVVGRDGFVILVLAETSRIVSSLVTAAAACCPFLEAQKKIGTCV